MVQLPTRATRALCGLSLLGALAACSGANRERLAGDDASMNGTSDPSRRPDGGRAEAGATVHTAPAREAFARSCARARAHAHCALARAPS